METEDWQIIEKFSDEIAKFSGRVIRREDDFYGIKFLENMCSQDLYVCVNNVYDIDETLKNRVLLMNIDLADFYARSIMVQNVPFFDLHPEHKKTFIEINEIISSFKCGLEIENNSQNLLVSRKDVIKLIKNIMKKKLPGFVIDNKNYFDSGVSFSVEWVQGHRFHLVVSVGKKSRNMSFLIGLDNPNIFYDYSNIFAAAQSEFKYITLDDVDKNINLALEVIEPLQNKLMKVLRNIY